MAPDGALEPGGARVRDPQSRRKKILLILLTSNILLYEGRIYY